MKVLRIIKTLFNCGTLVGINRITIETSPYYLGEPIVWNDNQDSLIKSALTDENISRKVGKETQNLLPGSNKAVVRGELPQQE